MLFEGASIGGVMVIMGEAMELQEARVTAYALLARLFRREVDRALLEGLVESDAEVVFKPGMLGEGEMESTLHELAADYARVFLMGRGSVHPYESAYTSDKGLLMQEAFRDVQACYAASGFEVSPDSDEMADHVALELEFMARLASRMREAMAEDNVADARSLLDRQRSFHRIHLRWIARFAKDVEARAETEWYGTVARILDDVVASDGVLMEELDAFLREAESREALASA